MSKIRAVDMTYAATLFVMYCLVLLAPILSDDKFYKIVILATFVLISDLAVRFVQHGLIIIGYNWFLMIMIAAIYVFLANWHNVWGIIFLTFLASQLLTGAHMAIYGYEQGE